MELGQRGRTHTHLVHSKVNGYVAVLHPQREDGQHQGEEVEEENQRQTIPHEQHGANEGTDGRGVGSDVGNHWVEVEVEVEVEGRGGAWQEDTK